MAKYYGSVGYATLVETVPGVWEEQIVERQYSGDSIRNVRKLQTTVGLNDSVTVTNELSILADPFANENFHKIRYATFMNSKWKINSIEVLYPRLILTLGGVYNGE